MDTNVRGSKPTSSLRASDTGRGALCVTRDMVNAGPPSPLIKLRPLAWCLLVPSLQGGATTHRPWSGGPGAFFSFAIPLGPLGQNSSVQSIKTMDSLLLNRKR